MRKISLIMILCFVASSLLLSETRQTVAVPVFDGEDGEILSDLVGSKLANKRVFKVITRTSVEAIMTENNFQRSKLTDISKAQALGKIINADFIIVGKITKFGTSYLAAVQMINVTDGEVMSGSDIVYKDLSETMAAIDEMVEDIVKSQNASVERAIAKQKGNLNYEEIKALVDIGVNARGDRNYTALIYAAQHGYIEIVKALIAAGSDVNAKNSSGDTALYWASYYGRTEIVNILKAAGAR